MKVVVGCVVWVVALVFYQSPIEKVDNKDKSFTLIKNDTINDSGIPVLKYKVMRNADKRIVMEGSVTMGVLEWTADYELSESKSLGTAHTSQDQRPRRIDLRPYLLKQ